MIQREKKKKKKKKKREREEREREKRREEVADLVCVQVPKHPLLVSGSEENFPSILKEKIESMKRETLQTMLTSTQEEQSTGDP